MTSSVQHEMQVSSVEDDRHKLVGELAVIVSANPSAIQCSCAWRWYISSRTWART